MERLTIHPKYSMHGSEDKIQNCHAGIGRLIQSVGKYLYKEIHSNIVKEYSETI